MSEKSTSSTIETSTLWERVGYVEISIGDADPMVFKGLDFKFSVRKVLANMVEGTMKVEIHGIPQDKINEIITVCDQQEAINQRKRVKVYAGYKKPDNKEYEGDLIACMDIIYASVTSPPPDLWLTIEGVQSNYYRHIVFKYKTEAGFRKEVIQKTVTTLSDQVSWLLPAQHKIWGMDKVSKYRIVKSDKTDISHALVDVEYWFQKYLTIEQIVDDLVKCINKAFEKGGEKRRITSELHLSDANKAKQVASFIFEGSMDRLIAQIGMTFNVFCFLEYSDDNEDCLVIMDNDPKGISSPPEGYFVNKDRKKRQIRTKKLDTEHGLIGIPSIGHVTSLKCRCLLDPSLTVGDYIDITSAIMPQVHSEPPGWQINKISFSGHLRGNEWYTDITAIDPRRLKKTTLNPIKTYILTEAKQIVPNN